MWFLVSSFTFLATFRGNTSDFAGLFLPKDVRIAMTTSLWNFNIPIFCFCTVWKRFHAFVIEAFTAHAKKGHRHFFDLMRTLYVDTNWSNRLTPPICLLQSSKGFDIGTSTHSLGDFDHHWAVLTELQVTWLVAQIIILLSSQDPTKFLPSVAKS